MTIKANKDLNRKKVFHNTEELYKNPKNYNLYVSKKDNPKLNRKIKSGKVELTLQDIFDKGEDLNAKSS